MGHKVSRMNAMEHSHISNIPQRQSAFPFLAFVLLLTTAVSGFSPLKPHGCVSASRVPNQNSMATHSLDFQSHHPDIANSSISHESDLDTISRWKRKTTEAVTRLFPSKRRRLRDEEDYERRKQDWASRYTHVESLREFFGSNDNILWGDLDASTSRRLYKTLLPKALLELYKVGVRPEDLAPLAYEARVAAKLYARERCMVPARVFAMAYDGVRSYQRYGKFQVSGMSYDQIWDKYSQLILEEEGDLTDEDVTAKICLKILEKACQTNERIDKWVLRDADSKGMKEQATDLDSITAQLEQDVRDLLSTKQSAGSNLSVQRVQTLRMVARAKRRFQQMDNVLHPEHYEQRWMDDHRTSGNRGKVWDNGTHSNRHQ